MCVCVCVRACVRACARACVRACDAGTGCAVIAGNRGVVLSIGDINDIADGVTSQMRMVAADSIGYRRIHTSANHLTLESDVKKCLHWSKTWQMHFNVSMCAVLSVTINRNISVHDYFVGSQPGLITRTIWGLPSTQNYRRSHTSTMSRTKPARHSA